MKTKTKISIFSLFTGLVLLAGCASQEIPFAKTPVFSDGATNYVYSLAPSVSNALYTAAQLNKSFVPAPFNGAVEAGLGVISLILAGFLRFKNQKLATQQAAADLLASHVVATGTQQQLLSKAMTTPEAQAIAQHIDNNTPY